MRRWNFCGRRWRGGKAAWCFALLLMVALLVERFLPHSRHPRQELAGALVTVIAGHLCDHRRAAPIAARKFRRIPARCFPARSNFYPARFFWPA